MLWSEILLIVRRLDGQLTKVGNRIDTARARGDELWWQNHRESYSKRVRKVRALHRKLKHELANNIELSELLEDMQDSLATVCDVESSTVSKTEMFQKLKEIWDEFQAALDDSVRKDYDIFQRRDFVTDPKLCFVLMPFDQKYHTLYEKTIKPTVRKIKLRCQRADDIFTSNVIVQDIWKGINAARLIIADVTDRNVNVFYEIGLSHALRQPVILLSQNKKDIPFDVKHIRHIFYSDTPSGRKLLSRKLLKAINSVLKQGPIA